MNVLDQRFLKAVWFSKPNKLNLLALILPANNTTITLFVFGHERSSFPRMIKVDWTVTKREANHGNHEYTKVCHVVCDN